MKEKLKKIDNKIWIMIGGFFILIIVILFGGAYLYNQFFYKKTYQEVETIMLEAAQSYLEKHSEALPQTINGSVTVSVDDLVKEKEMKSISTLLKDENTSCTGEVKVTNINENYRYAVYLNCGDEHQTKNFIDYIHENVEVTESGNGLYNFNNELVYRGDEVNNYIEFSGNTYRIVKFSEGQTVIILTEKLDSVVWDDRYNTEKNSNSGINDYSISRARSYLNDLYEGTNLILEKDKLLVVAHTIGIGKRSTKDTDNSGNLEGATVLENQYIGLLEMHDFLNASWDTNCTDTVNPACSNYNYLAKFKYSWWTITADSQSTYKVFRISSRAYASSANANAYLRPVLHLSEDAIYVSGDGSKENPYVVK